MTDLYVSVRDAGLTVALLTHGKRESLPGYVTGSRPETVTSSGPTGQPRVRQTGGMTAEQFDRVFPLWAAQYPGGRLATNGRPLGAVQVVR